MAGDVLPFLKVAGSEGLPLPTVDGITVLTGACSTREQRLRYTGLIPNLKQVPVAVPAGAIEFTGAENTGCGPAGCC